MLRVISCNVNGIRAAARKGFFTWLAGQQADVVCLQEVRAQEEQLTDPVFHPEGYHCHYVAAEKKGYSGVAIYSKRKPDAISQSWGNDLSDKEGRYLQVSFGKLHIVSLYLPSGTSGDERQAVKYHYMDHYLKLLKKNKKKGDSYIITGDFNIVHKERDIKNWKSNQKSSGVLPEERAWLDMLFDDIGYIDAFRVLNQESEQYTWWSQRANARANNVGWRIDYQVVTPDLKDKIESVCIDGEEPFSDHAPLIIDYAIED